MKLTRTKTIKHALLGLTCCASMQTIAATSDVNITFVELNDLHANLVPHKDMIHNTDNSVAVGTRGGMARIKTIIDGIRRQNSNTVVMNIGDTFHGGVEAFYSLGNAVADPLNALGIDIGVAGNWDYYFTPAITRARYGRIEGLEGDVVEVTIPGFDNPIPIKRPHFTNLGANVRDITNVLPNDFFPATQMMTYGSVKVGFIGFTSDIVETMHPMLAQGMDFAHGLVEHRDLLVQHAKTLRSQGADIVVVMSELGLPKDIALSKALAEMAAAKQVAPGLINVFFSAHTHELTKDMITHSQDGKALYAPVVEPGNDGYVGQMDVRMSYTGSTTTGIGRRKTTEQNWKVAGMSWKIIVVDESVPEDLTVKALVDKERAPFLADTVNLHALPFFMQTLDRPINTVIGHVGSVVHQRNALSHIISRNHSMESTFNTAWGDTLLDVSRTHTDIPDAEVAITPGFRMGTTLPEAGFLMENGVIATGDITLEDAYRFFPMYYGLVTADATGEHLRNMAEASLKQTYSADGFNTIGGWNYEFAGIDFDLNLANGDGARILSMRHHSTGQEIQSEEIVKVIGCRRLPIDFQGYVCGMPGFTNVQTVMSRDGALPWSMLNVFTYMLENMRHELGSTRTGVVDLSSFPMFPETTFIQPPEGTGGIIQPHDPNDPCGFFKWKCSSDAILNN